MLFTGVYKNKEVEGVMVIPYVGGRHLLHNSGALAGNPLIKGALGLSTYL